MPAFNQNRSRIVQLIFIGAFVLITLQLINLQVFSTKYKMAADNNAFYRKVIYPDRGIIFDRKKKTKRAKGRLGLLEPSVWIYRITRIFAWVEL